MYRLITHSALLLVVAFTGYALPEAPAADAPPRDAPKKLPRRTGHDAFADALAFNRRTLVGAYDKSGRRDPKWDGPARDLLEKTAQGFTTYRHNIFYWSVPQPPDAERLELGRRAVDAGCDDPLVLYCYAMVQPEARHDRRLALMRKAAEGLAAPGYPRLRLYAAASRVANLTRDEAERKAARQTAEAARIDMVCQPLDDAARRALALILNDDLNVPAQRKAARALADALDARQDADPWVRDVFAGRLEIALAWDARGSDTIDKVTPPGYKSFQRHLADARARFTRAWKLAPQLPEAPSEMIIVAMGAGDELGEDPMQWFERSTDAQVDYDKAYGFMYDALLPRWGGSHEKIQDLAMACADTGHFDTLVPWFFTWGMQAINRDVLDYAEVYSDPDRYATLVKVCEGYAAALEGKKQWPSQTSGKGSVDYYKTYHAAVAWKTGKYDEAKRVLDGLGVDRVDARPFRQLGPVDSRDAVSEVYAMAGPHAPALREARGAHDAGDAAAAAKAYAVVMAKLDDKDPALPYVRARARAADAAVKLAAGEWVDVQPVDTLAGWRPVSGTWRLDADGALVGLPQVGGWADKQSVIAWTGALFAADDAFEIAGHFELVERPNHDTGGAGALLIRDDSEARNIVQIDRDDNMVYYWGLGPRSPKFPAQVGIANDFVVRYDRKTVTTEVNGRPVGEPVRLTSTYFDDGLRTGVAARTHSEVRFTGLKLRRISRPAVDTK